MPAGTGPDRRLAALRAGLVQAQQERDRVRQLIAAIGRECLQEGMSYTELAAALGITKPTAINWFGRKRAGLVDARGPRL